MRFAVLGPVEVIDGDRRVMIGGARQRRLLCSLVAANGDVVSASRLAEEIWDRDRPQEPTRAVRSYIARLRRALGDSATVVQTKAPGYLFEVGSHTVDAFEFERLVSSARDESTPFARSESLRSALALWRGSAYEEFADLAWIRPEVERLEGLRVAATQELFATELTQGAGASLVPDLEREVERFPFDERLRGFLMEALARAGRPVEALRGFHRFRELLAEETGLEPGQALYEAERFVLSRSQKGDSATMLSERDSTESGRVTTGNLPAETTSFVGRQDEIVELVHLLDETRLLTLTGPGGSGKTRLAIRVAGLVSSRFPGGVWLVDVSKVGGSQLVADAVVAALDLPRIANQTATGVVAAALGFPPALLILDTCENVIDGVAELADAVLKASGEVTIIATSREALDTPAETARVVGSLGQDAVELFHERASATTAAFALTSENIALAEQICDRVDGLPLAIELAAARVATDDLHAIASSVDGTLGILGGSGRGRPERHETLERTIMWSYESLDPVDRVLFNRLSVFGTNFTAAAVEGVCAGEQVVTSEIVSRLARLTRKSMVEGSPVPSGRRFRLLDTLQTFARERLDETGQTDSWFRRHATYFADWLDQIDGLVHGSAEADHLVQLRADAPNIRNALEYAIESGDLDTAARLLLGSGMYMRHLGVPGLAHLAEQLLELPSIDEHSRAPELLHEIAVHLSGEFGHTKMAMQLLKRALLIGETPLVVSTHGALTGILGDQHAGWPEIERAWKLAETTGDEYSQLRIAPPTIYAFAGAGKIELAKRRWQDARALADSHPAPATFGALIDAMAIVFADSDPELARQAVARARDVGAELGLRPVSSRATAHLAQLELKAGRPEQALALAVSVVADDFDSGNARMDLISWMHRVVAILAQLGRTESAVFLHHAIPSFGVWAGDEPAEHIRNARRRLDPEIFDHAAKRGQAASFQELIEWVRTLPENSE